MNDSLMIHQINQTPLPDNVSEPLVYFSNTTHRRNELNRLNIDTFLPAWIPQRLLSSSVRPMDGALTVDTCVQNMGVFVWSPELSNVHALFSFNEHSIYVDGIQYANSEAYFQANKISPYRRTSDFDNIRTAAPLDSWSLGRSVNLRTDWEYVKLDIMRTALKAKLASRPFIQEILLSTKTLTIAQLKSDTYWGTGVGPNAGFGQNMLGKIWMDIRSEIKLKN